MTTLRNYLVSAVVFLAAFLAARPMAWAESGNVINALGAGLTLEVNSHWVPGGAYRPVKVTITPTVPVRADRTLTIEFLVSVRWIRDDYTLRVTRDVEIPAGSGPVEVVFAVPQMIGQCNVRINTIEDGRLVKTLSSGWSTMNDVADQNPERFPSVLFVGDKAPDTSELSEAVGAASPDSYSNPGAYANPAAPGVATVPPPSAGSPKPAVPLYTAITRSARQLPRRWIEYTNCDIICLSLDELKVVGGQNPDAFRAILQWARAGGNLWVFGVGRDWNRLPELESLAGLPERSPAVLAGAEPLRGWTTSNTGLYGQPLRGVEDSGQSYGPNYGRSVRVARPSAQVVGKPAVAESSEPPKVPPFVTRQYDLGLIAAISSESPFPGKAAEWRWLLNTMDSHRWLWSQRHGVSMVQPNPEFWNFPIPGVGLPPLNAFRILITLFVLAIGPLNYFLLRRWHRIQLLVVTIPLAAAAVTVALFAYAVVADGLGTRVRARSVTVLDQRRGQAACWARLAFYCGLTPSGGLTFPADVAVLRLDYNPSETGTYRQDMTWEKDQHLANGWLAARTPTQLLTVRSRPSQARLEITPPKDKSQALEVVNGLGTHVVNLLICDADGKFYWATDIWTDATVQAQPVELNDAMGILRQAHRDHLPEYPTGLDRNSLSNPYSRGYRGYWYGGNYGMAAPSQQTNRLESTLQTLGAGGNSGLEPGSFLAIVGQSPEVLLGTPSAREEAGFHVILGRW